MDAEEGFESNRKFARAALDPLLCFRYRAEVTLPLSLNSYLLIYCIFNTFLFFYWLLLYGIPLTLPLTWCQGALDYSTFSLIFTLPITLTC